MAKTRLRMYLFPEEGLFGIHVKRGSNAVTWKQLSYDEKSELIEYMEKAIKVCKANRALNEE